MASNGFGQRYSASGLGIALGERVNASGRNGRDVGALGFARLLEKRGGKSPVCRVRMSGFDEAEPANSNGCCEQNEVKLGRRDVGMAATLAIFVRSSSTSSGALAAGFDKYLKMKKLDPLATYVPTVLLAQSQFQEVDGKLGGEQKMYADARSLLRVGPAASLRTDIRAVAQYAKESGNDDTARAAVDQCLSALEDLDSLLLQASRSDGAPIERMRKDLTTTVTALDRLLATVPTPILEKAREIAQAYKEASY